MGYAGLGWDREDVRNLIPVQYSTDNVIHDNADLNFIFVYFICNARRADVAQQLLHQRTWVRVLL